VEVGLNQVEQSTGRKEYMNITIPITPVSKKNHSQIIRVKGRLMVIPSKQYRDYEKACAEFIPQMPFNMFDCPVNVKCLYYMPTHRRVDLVNLLQCTCDILVKYGILKDDNSNIVVSMDGSRVLYDKEHPRTEIEIIEI
jgi:Holliday junction resolvase RusA-like endonuclease